MSKLKTIIQIEVSKFSSEEQTHWKLVIEFNQKENFQKSIMELYPCQNKFAGSKSAYKSAPKPREAIELSKIQLQE